jgi:zinc/manganese transport system substrate-binding protein
MRLLFFIALFIQATTFAAAEKISVVVSFSILAEFAAHVCTGVPDIHIETLVPLDADPHTYDPKPADLVSLSKAHIVFLNGFNFEPRIEAILKNAAFKGVLCYASEGISQRSDCQDPHAWHDVQQAIIYVQNITKMLKSLCPQHAVLFDKNAQKYIAELATLHTWILEKFSTIPMENRLVITTHDAFWYYGRAYGVRFLSPIGVSTEEQMPSADKIRDLIQVIRHKGIQVIFTENLANSQQIRQIAQETGVRSDETLYADSLSVRPEADSYIRMLQHNTSRIVNSLLPLRLP